MESKQMAFDRTIEEHRAMWNWIADESLKRRKKLMKKDYLEEVFNDSVGPMYSCFCCEYQTMLFELCGKDKPFNFMEYGCMNCPIIWPHKNEDGSFHCEMDDSPFRKWEDLESNEYEEAARLAKIIAELPAREKTAADI